MWQSAQSAKYFRQAGTVRSNFLQLLQQLQGKILGPPGRGDHPVGHGLLQFGAPGAGCLRQSEVLLQSGGAPHRHRATHPDQFAGFGIQHLFVLKISKQLLTDLHEALPVF